MNGVPRKFTLHILCCMCLSLDAASCCAGLEVFCVNVLPQAVSAENTALQSRRLTIQGVEKLRSSLQARLRTSVDVS